MRPGFTTSRFPRGSRFLHIRWRRYFDAADTPGRMSARTRITCGYRYLYGGPVHEARSSHPDLLCRNTWGTAVAYSHCPRCTQLETRIRARRPGCEGTVDHHDRKPAIAQLHRCSADNFLTSPWPRIKLAVYMTHGILIDGQKGTDASTSDRSKCERSIHCDSQGTSFMRFIFGAVH